MLTWVKVRNPYEVLELPSNASSDEIRLAFRRLAALSHPDRHQNSQEAQARFTEINSAYQILSDPHKRAAYDRYGERAFRPGGTAGATVNFETMVTELLKAVRAGRSDGSVKQVLELSFAEAAEGCHKQVRYERINHCSACNGSGAARGSSTTRCAACSGKGRVRTAEGILSILRDRTCSKCRGTGRLAISSCRDCGGRGLGRYQHSVDVDVPPGTIDGATQSVPGAGHRLVPNGKYGRLEISIRVLSHPFFSRSGDDILCTVPVSMVTAALGGQVEIPTLSGKIKLTIPVATQPGTVLRVRGKGLQHRLRSGRGDQLVEVKVEVPSQLSERARDLLTELDKEIGSEQAPEQRSFVERLKDLFG
jgi:molecular chaperone DnaJ